MRRFALRARDRRVQSAKPWLIAALAVAIIGASAWVVFGTSLLGVRQIRVTGLDVLAADDVRAAAAVPLGTPLAGVDLGAVARRIQALPPAKSASVSREWPSTLHIAIHERVAIAAVPIGKSFALLDPTGVAYFQVGKRPPGLPLVKMSKPAPGDPTTQSALTVLAALTEPLRTAMTALVAESPSRIRLELSGGRSIIWGDATESARKAVVATALLSQSKKTIDVSAPDVVTMR